MKRLIWMLAAAAIFVWAPAMAQTGIVYPLPNQPVALEDGRVRVDLRGAPRELWSVSVNSVPWERAALDDDGRLTLRLPAPDDDDLLITATSVRGSSSVVVRPVSAAQMPADLPPPPDEAPGSLSAPAILSPSSGTTVSTDTVDVVVSGPPGAFAILRGDGIAMATFQFDESGVEEVRLGSFWTGDMKLSLETGDVEVATHVIGAHERTKVAVAGAQPDPANGRSWRLVGLTGLSMATIMISFAPSFHAAYERDDGQLGDDVRWGALASVLAVPMVGLVPYLYGDVDFDIAIPFAVAVAGGLAAFAGAHLLAQIDYPDARLAFLAPPLVAFVFTFSAYESAHAVAQQDAWQVVAGPGDAGISLRRTW